MDLIKCAACEKQISPNARACPHCGEPQRPDNERTLERLARISPALTPLMIAVVGGAFTFFKYQDDKKTREEEKAKNAVWLQQERDIAVARDKANRAIELLDYLVSDKEEKRRMSILLSLAIASQKQLPEGLIPVLIQAGAEDKGFSDKMKFALIDLRREASTAGDERLIARVDEALKRLFHPLAIDLLKADTFDARETLVDTVITNLENDSVRKSDSVALLQEAHQVIRRSSNTPQELHVLEQKIIDKFKEVAGEAKADSEIAKATTEAQKSDAVSANQVLEVAREILPVEERDAVFEKGAANHFPINRLVIAVNDKGQRAMAAALVDRLQSKTFANVVEDVREKGSLLPKGAEIRYRDPGDESIPDPVREIQRALEAEGIVHDLKPYPERFIAVGEFEVWFGDGQVF